MTYFLLKANERGEIVGDSTGDLLLVEAGEFEDAKVTDRLGDTFLLAQEVPVTGFIIQDGEKTRSLEFQTIEHEEAGLGVEAAFDGESGRWFVKTEENF